MGVGLGRCFVGSLYLCGMKMKLAWQIIGKIHQWPTETGHLSEEASMYRDIFIRQDCNIRISRVNV